VKEGHGNVVEVLLSKRERRKELLSAKTNLGDSVLHLAAINGDLNIAHLLIQEGAELDLKNNDGETPLSIAQREKNVQMANIFIAAADIKGKESSTTSPLFGLLVNGFQTLAERISSRHESLDKRISGTHSPIHVQ
jgi:ankyrin repeat protein